MLIFIPRGPINLRFYVLLYYTWSNIPLSHSYCHNSGQSKTGLSNLEWYYYRKIITTHHNHTTTTPPPHVPLQLKAIQCIQYYVNCTVQRCMTSIAINVCYHYILGDILSHFSYDTSSIQHNVIPSVGHQQVLVSNITIRKVFLCVIW